MNKIFQGEVKKKKAYKSLGLQKLGPREFCPQKDKRNVS